MVELLKLLCLLHLNLILCDQLVGQLLVLARIISAALVGLIGHSCSS